MTIFEQWVHCTLHGVSVWVRPDVLAGKEHGAAAPDHHMTKGRLDPVKCFDNGGSYAHVYPDMIVRYGKKIGDRSDLLPVDAEAHADS